MAIAQEIVCRKYEGWGICNILMLEVTGLLLC